MQENPVRPARSAPAGPLLPAAHILIVDDDELLRCSTQVILQQRSFVVDTVGDGRSALNFLKDHQVDVLITDIYMPNCDGLELILALRKRIDRPRVIAMTGGIRYLRPDILNMVQLMGVDGILLKPFEGESLLLMVKKLLEAIAQPVASAI